MYSYLLLCIFVVGGYFWLKRQKNNQYPRGYTPYKKCEVTDRSEKIDCIRDRFKMSKVPSNLDAIVIGSGIGGLSCAAFLSKAGKKVLVLEQHDQAGGSTHTFEDKGFEFDTGVHYIGNIHKRKKILDLITDQPLEWEKMGQDNDMIYDEIWIGNHREDGDSPNKVEPTEQGKYYNLRAGEENFIADLVKEFPDEEEAIRKYVDLVKEVAKKDFFFMSKIAKPAWLSKLLNPYLSKNFFEMTKKSTTEVLESLTSNRKLIAVLGGQWGDHGELPDKASFFMHASVVNHYMEGGWFIKGGSSEIARQLTRTIEKAGGRVLVAKKVEKILIQENYAGAVQMETGDIIEAPHIISGAGVMNTYKMVDPQWISPRIQSKLDLCTSSPSMIYLFVGMNKSKEELKLRSSNIWSWPQGDYNKMMEEYESDPFNNPMPLFIGFPCAKDSTWNERYPANEDFPDGRSNAVILTMGKYEVFEAWEDMKHKKRGNEYNALKEKYKNKILQELYKHYPQIEGTVVYAELGTPLTFKHYIAEPRGGVYGLNISTDSAEMRFSSDDWLRPETEINGLYLTSQDLTTLGITGAMMAGVLTAHSVLGYGHIEDLISGRNLVEDVMHLPE